MIKEKKKMAQHYMNAHAGERLSALVLVWGSAVALYASTLYNAGFIA